MTSGVRFSMNLGLDNIPNPVDPANFSENLRMYNAIRALAAAVDLYAGPLPYDTSIWNQLTPAQTLWTAGANRLYLQTTDNLAAGSMCSIWDNGGTYMARLAGGPAWVGGDCRGFSTGVYAAGSMAEIMLFGLCTVVSGLTRGAPYWISNAVAGAFTGTKPANTGNLVQPIGYAIEATSLFFNPSVLVPTRDNTLAVPVLKP